MDELRQAAWGKGSKQQPGLPVPEQPRKRVLYRCYNAKGTLLYVGITVSIWSRTYQHLNNEPWLAEVVSMRLQHLSPMLKSEAWTSRNWPSRRNIPSTTRQVSNDPPHGSRWRPVTLT